MYYSASKLTQLAIRTTYTILIYTNPIIESVLYMKAYSLIFIINIVYNHTIRL